MILAEIRLDTERVAEPGRRTEGNDRRAHTARPRFERRMLPVSEGNMLKRRLLIEEGRQTGHDFLRLDLISATAPACGPATVSSETRDYEKATVPAATVRPATAGL